MQSLIPSLEQLLRIVGDFHFWIAWVPLGSTDQLTAFHCGNGGPKAVEPTFHRYSVGDAPRLSQFWISQKWGCCSPFCYSAVVCLVVSPRSWLCEMGTLKDLCAGRPPHPTPTMHSAQMESNRLSVGQNCPQSKPYQWDRLKAQLAKFQQTAGINGKGEKSSN